jgi:hypothetical protein
MSRVILVGSPQTPSLPHSHQCLLPLRVPFHLILPVLFIATEQGHTGRIISDSDPASLTQLLAALVNLIHLITHVLFTENEQGHAGRAEPRHHTRLPHASVRRPPHARPRSRRPAQGMCRLYQFHTMHTCVRTFVRVYVYMIISGRRSFGEG